MKYFPIHTTTYVTLHDSFSDFLKAKGFSKGTQSMLPACIQEFLFKMEQGCIHELKEVTPKDIQEHYHYLVSRPNIRRGGGLSPTMLNHHVYALRTFFAWLEKIDGIEVNPITGLDFPKPYTPPRKPLSKEQIQLLYAACENDRDRVLLGVYYACGLRRSEGEDLSTRDISFADAKLIVREGKFKKRREIPLHPKVMEHFRTYLQGQRQILLLAQKAQDMYAFLLNNEGIRMSGAKSNDRVKYLSDKVGIKQHVSLHHLRHSVATHLKENGMHLEQIMEYLGHSSLDITQAYLEGYRTNWQWQRKHKSKLRFKDEEENSTPDYENA